jgi:hypothetical protein
MEGDGVRCIGLDVHQRFCVVAICEDGGEVRLTGRVQTSPQQLELFAASLAPTDRVVLEATGAAFADWTVSRPTKVGAGATQGHAPTRPSTRQAARQAQAPEPAL